MNKKTEELLHKEYSIYYESSFVKNESKRKYDDKRSYKET